MSNVMRLKKSENGYGDGIFLYDFATHANFRDPCYPADITGEVRGRFKDLHPSMIIGSGMLGMEVIHVRISYTTRRGNRRETDKYVFFPKDELPEEEYEMEIMVEGFIQNYYSSKKSGDKYCSIGNVEILSIERYAEASINVG